MNIREYIKNNILIFDGAMGTMLQRKGLNIGEGTEKFNITHSEIVKSIHREYIEAGARVITTNTFGANEIRLKNTPYSVEEIICSAINIAKEAMKGKRGFIALDIGPIGRKIGENEEIDFNRAKDIFKRQIKEGIKYEIDLVIIETMTDLYEMKSAILGVKEVCDIPIFATMAFSKEGRTYGGSLPETMALQLEKLGVDGIGVNCTEEGKNLEDIVRRISENTTLPVIVMPNAGTPKVIKGKLEYDITKEEFSKGIKKLINNGVSIVGGCCGTTPEFIKELSKTL
ncbi:homocysteine S-methyltransferase family protein [Eubacterium multiforme]|uniref:Methionine synthase I (Cobalamin-dependent) n=1 Tax=Eubacterium multiforme TaxID=83339 RepID=A0ABT9UPC3_9FIRM|nr:homocysteine S-methyltransferase family protein [Eubacterium multiforme]MDQ0148494.1 methionine synthase I (cobalamin-dependent) [Eubacterium multiforme]